MIAKRPCLKLMSRGPKADRVALRSAMAAATRPSRPDRRPTGGLPRSSPRSPRRGSGSPLVVPAPSAAIATPPDSARIKPAKILIHTLIIHSRSPDAAPLKFGKNSPFPVLAPPLCLVPVHLVERERVIAPEAREFPLARLK